MKKSFSFEFQSLQQRGGYSKKALKTLVWPLSSFNRFNSAGGIPSHICRASSTLHGRGFNRFNSAGGIPRFVQLVQSMIVVLFQSLQQRGGYSKNSC